MKIFRLLSILDPRNMAERLAPGGVRQQICNGTLAKCVFHHGYRRVKPFVQRAKMAPVRRNPQRTLPDPLNGIDYVNDFEDADFFGRPGQQKSAVLAPLGGYQSPSAERLHDFGKVPHWNQRCRGDLLVGLGVVGVASQPNDSPKRVLDSLRQHLDIWTIISISLRIKASHLSYCCGPFNA
jgi:hypothetical protein